MSDFVRSDMKENCQFHSLLEKKKNRLKKTQHSEGRNIMNEDQLLADGLTFGNVIEVLESPGKLLDKRESQSMGKKGSHRPSCSM